MRESKSLNEKKRARKKYITYQLSNIKIKDWCKKIKRFDFCIILHHYEGSAFN